MQKLRTKVDFMCLQLLMLLSQSGNSSDIEYKAILHGKIGGDEIMFEIRF